MTAALPFTELLERAGARPGRYGRKWHCPHCPERSSASLSVDEQQEVFFCHRCQWKGGRRTLERELGILGQEPTAAEVHKRRLIRTEAEGFTAWIAQRRYDAAVLCRELDRHEDRLREAGREELAAGKSADSTLDKLALLLPWQEQAEARWRRLCDLESNFETLYDQFTNGRRAA